MSAAAPIANSSAILSVRRLSEFEASKEVSHIAAWNADVSVIIDSIARLALKVGGVRRIELTYANHADGTSLEPFSWGAGDDGSAVGSAVANIASGGQHWGELRLTFDLQPSAIESPLRFAKFLAQQIGSQLTRWSHEERARQLRIQSERIRRIIEKRKAIQRARAIVANTEGVNDSNALLLMRKYSRESGRTLYQVAEALIFGDAGKWTRPRYIPRKRAFRLLGGKHVASSVQQY